MSHWIGCLLGGFLLVGAGCGSRQNADDAGERGSATGGSANETEQITLPDKTTPDDADDADHATPARHSYVVRALVVDVPTKDRPRSDLTLRHEAIPDFVRADGTLGMASMQMGFFPENTPDLSGVKVGDKIEFTWTVWWDGQYPHSTIDGLRVLDAQTTLDFGGG